MKNFTIITPTFNDWKSLNKLIFEIDKNLKNLKGHFSIFVINDCSTIKPNLSFKKLKNIKKIKILNLSRNLGSQKAIYTALVHLKNKIDKSIITIIDSDGEDDPTKITKMIKLSLANPNLIITANRLKRTEIFFYKILNYCRLIFTFILTGKYIDFGNFSSFNGKLLNKILINRNLGLAYSAGILKNYKGIKKCYLKKRKRYYGDSKVSLFFLIKHSLNIISVFLPQVFLRSILFIILIFGIGLNIQINIILSLLLIFLNFSLLIINLNNNFLFKKSKIVKNVLNFKT